jgi:hypothetical protein
MAKGIFVGVAMGLTGCGGLAHDEVAIDRTIPVYVNRALPHSGPDSWVAARATASGDNLDLSDYAAPGDRDSGACFAGPPGTSSGELALTFAQSVNLAALGVTGIVFAVYAGAGAGTLYPRVVAEDASGTYCHALDSWDATGLDFDTLRNGEGCDGATPPAAGSIRSFRWKVPHDDTTGEPSLAFCVRQVSLVDDSYLTQ